MSTVAEPISRINRDLLKASADMSIDEARWTVDLYYAVQEFRKSSANQVRAELKADKAAEFLTWTFDSMSLIENTMKAALNKYSSKQELGHWCKSIVGIGPVISAGLMAHIDIQKCPTVGHIWRYAGLDPTSIWEKGQKRPWNASLKVLCYKIGESFVKVSNMEGDVYGKVYQQRKLREADLNSRGEFAEQAKHALKTRNFTRDTVAKQHYTEGKLPPAHIHARARRYATKLFLSAFHEVAYWLHFRQLPPFPYAIEHLGHAHYFGVPNEELVPGLSEAKRKRGR